MDSPDWRAAMARAKRLGIDAYQTGRVRFDPTAATTVLVERVTSNEPWGPTSKDCAAIADLTFDAVEAPRVMEVIWRRLSGDAASGPKNWRKVHKTLALLDFLIKHGAVGVIDEASSHAMTFAALSRFSAPRAGVGGGAMAAGVPADAEEGCRLVRDKAAALLSLLDDTDALRRVRSEAQRVAGRFVGLGRDSLGGREGGGRRSLAFGSSDDDVAPASRGVTIATAGGSREALGAPRVRPFSMAGGSIASRGLHESFEPYSPPSPTTDDAPKPVKLAPTIAPPPASAFGPWTSARFTSTSATSSAPAVQLPPAQTDAFAELFAGVELASPAPAESSAASGAASDTNPSGGAGGGDPFASLLDAVDERMAATLAANNRGPDTEPLCAEAAVTWNVPTGGTPQPYAPNIDAALASTAATSSAGASGGDAMDAFLFEESRRQLAAVQLHPAMWGPGSSLSPRPPPQQPVMAPVFRAAQPAEPNLIDL